MKVTLKCEKCGATISASGMAWDTSVRLQARFFGAPCETGHIDLESAGTDEPEE